MHLVWVSLLACIASCLLTGFIRRYALATDLLDMPNDRSSHTIPTPRGGGIAVVLSFLIFLIPVSVFYTEITSRFLFALVGAGCLVAFIGFMDDHGNISALWRLIVHFSAAVWALLWFGNLPPLQIFGANLNLGLTGDFLCAIYLVWLTNLYNFMDGIDGIASIEIITVCFGGALIYIASSSNNIFWFPPVLLIGSVTGFLIWNLPRARIFLGDSGSGFLGIVSGIFSIQAASVDPELFWCWIILLGTFIVDASVTLLRRVLRAEELYKAHRSHAYQYASRKFRSHLVVSLMYGMINLIWLLPIAYTVSKGWLDGLFGVLIAYVPLIWLAVKFKAGAKELQEV